MRVFGLRGRISIEAAQANVYHTPVSRGGITRPIQTHISHSLAGRRGPLRKLRSVLDSQRQGDRGGACESRRGGAPLDPHAIPKARNGTFAANPQLHGGVGFVGLPGLL